MSAHRFTFVEQARLGGRALFFLWQSDMELSGVSTVLREAGGQIPTFATADEARAYAQRIGLTVEREGGAHVYDLDAVRRWCQDARPDTLNAAQVFMAWKLLEDAAVAAFPNALSGEPDWAADQLADKLGTHLTETDHPPPGWEPHQWTLDEAKALAALLRPHVERLADEFESPAA
jgi:hypothetical protein